MAESRTAEAPPPRHNGTTTAKAAASPLALELTHIDHLERVPEFKFGKSTIFAIMNQWLHHIDVMLPKHTIAAEQAHFELKPQYLQHPESNLIEDLNASSKVYNATLKLRKELDAAFARQHASSDIVAKYTKESTIFLAVEHKSIRKRVREVDNEQLKPENKSIAHRGMTPDKVLKIITELDLLADYIGQRLTEIRDNMQKAKKDIRRAIADIELDLGDLARKNSPIDATPTIEEARKKQDSVLLSKIGGIGTINVDGQPIYPKAIEIVAKDPHTRQTLQRYSNGRSIDIQTIDPTSTDYPTSYRESNDPRIDRKINRIAHQWRIGGLDQDTAIREIRKQLSGTSWEENYRQYYRNLWMTMNGKPDVKLPDNSSASSGVAADEACRKYENDKCTEAVIHVYDSRLSPEDQAALIAHEVEHLRNGYMDPTKVTEESFVASAVHDELLSILASRGAVPIHKH